MSAKFFKGRSFCDKACRGTRKPNSVPRTKVAANGIQSLGEIETAVEKNPVSDLNKGRLAETINERVHPSPSSDGESDDANPAP